MERTDEPFVIETPAQWKAFSHPLRLRILERLAGGPQTNEELAAALGEQSGKLYFHTKKLLDAGLIVPDSTRQKGPITEKLYKAVGHGFTTPAPVKGGAAPPLEPALAAGLDLYRASWRETGGLAGRTELGFHLVLPHDPERRAEFIERLQALADDFQESASDAPGAEMLALTALLHEVNTRGKKTKEKDDAPENDGTFRIDSSLADGAG